MSFLAGAAAGYKGYSEESRRIADEERRVKQDSRMDQEATFQEEMRGRQRTDWQDADAEKTAVANDRAALQKDRKSSEDDFLSKITDAPKAAEQPAESKAIAQIFSPVAKQVIVDPNAEKATSMPVVGGLAAKKTPSQLNQQIDLSNSAPVESQNVAPNAASIPQAGGITQKPRNFNSILDDELALLQKKVSRGKASAQDYAQSMKMVNQIKSEGVHDALNLMSSGDYEGAMDKFNSVGMRRGAKIISGREGVTLVDGDQVPTHFVTIQNADGTRTEVDVAKARYQLMDFDKQLANKDRSSTRQMAAKHYADSDANTKQQIKQTGDHQKAMERNSAAHLGLAYQQFNAGTPLGQIKSKEKALGRPLTSDERANLVGVDTLPQGIKMEAASLFKELENNSHAVAKASAEGTFQPTTPDGKSNPIMVRNAEINLRLGQLLNNRNKDASSDILGLNTSPAPQKPAAEQISPPTSQPIIPKVGGMVPQRSAPPSGSIDLRNDPVLSTLNGQLKTLDMNDPANTEKIMALGKAKNDRLNQLQEKYGRLTALITE